MREKETAVRDRYTVMITLLCTACLALLILIAFALSKPEEEQHIPAPEMNAEGLCTVTVKHMSQPTEAEILAMAQAMSGECYENEYGDMLKVGMAICRDKCRRLPPVSPRISKQKCLCSFLFLLNFNILHRNKLSNSLVFNLGKIAFNADPAYNTSGAVPPAHKLPRPSPHAVTSLSESGIRLSAYQAPVTGL